MLGSAVVRSAP